MYQVSYITNRAQRLAAERLGVEVAVIEAVMAVEARGDGFIRGTDLPVILFEGHIFHRETGGRFTDKHPSISYRSWTKAHYKGGRGEYDRLLAAMALDEDVALSSASWGLFQIMGFNHQAAGFGSVQDFVNAQATGEDHQLLAFASFVAANGAMLAALSAHDWAGFARRYNGPGYRQNAYDTKLAAEFARARRRGDDPERGDIAAVQAALNVAVAAGLAVDGWMGPRTEAAIRTYQEREGLELDGAVTPALLAALGIE